MMKVLLKLVCLMSGLALAVACGGSGSSDVTPSGGDGGGGGTDTGGSSGGVSTCSQLCNTAYSGSGIIDDRQRPGWLANLLNTIWPF